MPARGEFTPREMRQSDTHNSISIDPCGPHLGPLGAFLSGVTENVSSGHLLLIPAVFPHNHHFELCYHVLVLPGKLV